MAARFRGKLLIEECPIRLEGEGSGKRREMSNWH